MLRSLSVVPFAIAVLAVSLRAQDAPAPTALPVTVPTFANPTCPIMGKKVSMPLFVDTELGRFYVCCKPCYRKILKDVPAAHKTAYPTVETHANTTCPVSGEPIGDDAVEVTLQGHRFKVCCSTCVAAARTHSQVTLVKITDEKAADVGNTTCPVSGKPTTANAFVKIGDHIVHLAAPALADEVTKNPATVLDKARELAKAQPAKAPHVHAKPPAKAPAAGDKE